MNASGIDAKAIIIVKKLKLISTKKAIKHRIPEYNRASLTDTFPEAIGLSFVLNTFLSNFLSKISLTIQPAHLIKTDPKKNNIK